MKFRKNKKGFTIVELIIVIAVIGILTAVMVPTIVHLVSKANKASDEALVSNLNKAVQLRYAETSQKPATMYETVKGLEDYGYKLDALVAKSDQDLLYNLEENKFVLADDSSVAGNEGKFWKIQNSVTTDKYNIYASSKFEFEENQKIDVSFDAGENTRVTSVFYKSEGNNQNVIIRSNSTLTEVTVDAAGETVKHYGNAKVVNVTAVDKAHSYHEKGSVSSLNVKSGKIEVEEGAIVGKIAVATNCEDVTVVNDGTIFNTEVVTYTIAEGTGKVSTEPYEGSEPTPATQIVDNVEKADPESELNVRSAEALINLAYSHQQGIVGNKMNIKLGSDIDLSGKVWVPFGLSVDNPFEGTFDGNGKTIKGLHYDQSINGLLETFESLSEEGVPFGLIAYAQKDVTIKGLTVEADIEIANGEAVSAFIGVYNNLTTKDDSNEYKLEFSNCKAKGSVAALHKVAGFVGTGFISLDSKLAQEHIGVNRIRAKTAVKFENCTSSIAIRAAREANAKVGGFASGLPLFVDTKTGQIGGDSITISNCLFDGSINYSNTEYFGAFCGYITGSNVTCAIEHSTFTNSRSEIVKDVYSTPGTHLTW